MLAMRGIGAQIWCATIKRTAICAELLVARLSLCKDVAINGDRNSLSSPNN